MKRITKYLISIALLIIVVAIFYRLFYFTHNTRRIIISIPSGSSTAQIAVMLKKKGIIYSTRMFVYQCKSTGAEASLKAGKYSVEPRMPIWNLINKLRYGITIPPPRIIVSIPEGMNIYQIARILNADTDFINEKEFIRLCQSTDFIRETTNLPVSSLEGFLFPDTYKFFITASETEVILTMYDNFRRKTEEIRNSVNSFDRFYDILKLASIVEKETRIDTERPIIAGVYYNRLKKRIRLEADPTVRYALKKETGILTYRDLRIKSPYNTYRYFGLPPTPICNPGLKSIEAAANPAKVDYLYFVSNANGAHYFAKSFQEHLKNKRKYKRERWRQKILAREKAKNGNGTNASKD